MKKTVILIILIVFVSLAGYYLLVIKPAQDNKIYPTPSMITDQDQLLAISKTILSNIKNKSFSQIASGVPPTKGLVVKPYYTSSNEQGRIVSVDELKEFTSNLTVQYWGFYDGSGMPIDLSNLEYYNKFIYPVDFLNTAQVSFNKSLVVGNTLSLDEITASLFPNQQVSYVEYYVPGTVANGGMDWQSLTMVFEKVNGQWYLIGLLHNQWTI